MEESHGAGTRAACENGLGSPAQQEEMEQDESADEGKNGALHRLRSKDFFILFVKRFS